MSIIHWIGVDDHADKWSIACFRGSETEACKEFELVPNEAGWRKLLGWLKSLAEPRVVYEAGPCGYELFRRLTAAGIVCSVAAPSLTPRKPGDRVKTNRRDALKLARYLRSGDLTLISVPDPVRESLRDLIRARGSVRDDLLSAQHRLSKLLLRHGHRYRDGRAWTTRFWAWVKKIHLPHAFSQSVLDEAMLRITQLQEQLDRFDSKIEEAAVQSEYAPYVAALSVLRGIRTLSAMTIMAELGDLRRFSSAPS